MITKRLSSGYEIPMIGLGTWQAEPVQGDAYKAVKMALAAGYRYIDCATLYGNQKEIGKAIRESLGVAIKRADIFITSKIWNTHHSFEKAKEAIAEILAELQLDYLDLLLIHWPFGYQEGGSDMFPKTADGKTAYSDVDYLETWKALEEAVREGKVRSIGVSNFNHKQIQRVIDNSTIKPVALQVELHPYFQQTKLVNFCNDNGIAVTAYSPLCSPGAAVFHKEGDPSVIADKVVVEIAEKLGKTPAQVIFRWMIQRGINVIPKSTNESRIRSNLDVFSFSLDDGQMSSMTSLDRGWRVVDTGDSAHPHYAFAEEF